MFFIGANYEFSQIALISIAIKFVYTATYTPGFPIKGYSRKNPNREGEEMEFKGVSKK